LGVAVGFLFPPILVKNHDELDLIGRDLLAMFYLVAGLTTILVVLIVCFFQRAPPTPPSASAAIAEELNPNEESPFSRSVKNLFCNFNFVLLLISFGILRELFS
jgi:FLVCR family feline leukemia virus subgroup C receptor-related protein